MGERILVGKPEARRPLVRHRRRWDDNIKVGLREKGGGHGLDGSGLVQGQVAGACECGNKLLGSIKC